MTVEIRDSFNLWNFSHPTTSTHRPVLPQVAMKRRAVNDRGYGKTITILNIFSTFESCSFFSLFSHSPPRISVQRCVHTFEMKKISSHKRRMTMSTMIWKSVVKLEIEEIVDSNPRHKLYWPRHESCLQIQSRLLWKRKRV